MTLLLLRKGRVSDRNAAIATFFLGLVCLFFAIYHVKLLKPLLDHGVRAEAVVAGIHAGARGSKMAVYRYRTGSGAVVEARDIFQMYLVRVKKGEIITVIYDPVDASVVTADLGKWVWQGVWILLFGFFFSSPCWGY